MDFLKDNGCSGLYLDPDSFLIPLYLRNIIQVSRFMNFRLKTHRQLYVNRRKNMNFHRGGKCRT